MPALFSKTQQPRKEPKTIVIALLLNENQEGRKYRSFGEVEMGSPPPEVSDSSQSSGFENTLQMVKYLVDSAEGKVVSIEYEKGTKRPQSLEAEIPSEHYKAFYKKLKLLVNLESPSESIPGTHQASIPVRILFKSKK